MKVAFDCDGTLFHTSGDVPRYEIIDQVLFFNAIGADVYFWSGSGIDYARMVARKLGFEHHVYCIPKWGLQVDIAYDDQEGAKAQEGKNAKVVIIV